MDLRLAGKRAFVSGSSSGIGRGIATVLATEGAQVVVHGRNRERVDDVVASIRKFGGIAASAIGDLATKGGAAAVVDQVGEALDQIDILVNNVGGNEAAGGGLNGWFTDTDDVWAGTYEQNVLAAVRMVRAFVPQMREAGWGRVINVASAGATQPTPQVPSYCAAKAALLSMTISLSQELARSGVTVNSVSPGTTRTEGFVSRTLARTAEAHNWPDDVDTREQNFMDLGLFPCTTSRYGRPEEVGVLVAYLASPLSAFVNGANYRIDGGQVQCVN